MFILYTTFLSVNDPMPGITHKVQTTFKRLTTFLTIIYHDEEAILALLVKCSVFVVGRHHILSSLPIIISPLHTCLSTPTPLLCLHPQWIILKRFNENIIAVL